MTVTPPVSGALDVPIATPASPRLGSRLFRESAALHASLYVLIFFKFIGGFLVAKFLGPGVYGLRTALGFAVDYEPYTQLGTYESMVKEVPYHRARGDHAAADAILATVFTANLVMASGVGLLLMLSALLLSTAGVAAIYVGFVVFLGAYGLVSRVQTFYAVWLVAEKRSFVLSQLRMLHGSLAATLSVVLVIAFGLPGLFAGLFLAAAASLIWTVFRVRWVPPLQLSLPLVRRLVRAGFPIMAIGLLFVLFRNVDKMLILGMMSHEMLGYFAVAVIASAVVFDSVADLLRVMFFPRLMEQVARDNGRAKVREHLFRLTVLVGCLAPLLVGGLYLGVHLPIVHLAAEYMPAVGVAQTLALGQFFFTLGLVPLLVCVAMDRQGTVVLLTIAAILVDVALNTVLITAGWGIEGVAIGTGVSYGLFSVAVLILAVRSLGGRWQSAASLFGRLLLPFMYALILLLGLDRWMPVPNPGLWADMMVTALKVVIFLALYAIVPYILRGHPAFASVWEHLPGARRGASGG